VRIGLALNEVRRGRGQFYKSRLIPQDPLLSFFSIMISFLLGSVECRASLQLLKL